VLACEFVLREISRLLTGEPNEIRRSSDTEALACFFLFEFGHSEQLAREFLLKAGARKFPVCQLGKTRTKRFAENVPLNLF